MLIFMRVTGKTRTGYKQKCIKRDYHKAGVAEWAPAWASEGGAGGPSPPWT